MSVNRKPTEEDYGNMNELKLILETTFSEEFGELEFMVLYNTITTTSNLDGKSFEQSIDRYVNVYFTQKEQTQNKSASSCNSISSSSKDCNNSNSHNSNCGASFGNLESQIGWVCSACSFNNTKFETQCEICSTKKVQPKSSIKTSGWDCKYCTFHNTEDASNCAICMEK